MSGLFGVASQGDCSDILFYGTDYQSHLGTEFGGLAVAGDRIERVIHSLRNHQFKSRFFDVYLTLKGSMGIGVISADDPQPMMLNTRFGEFAVCIDGNIVNRDQLADELLAQGTSFSDPYQGRVNSAELVAKLISRGDNILDGIQKMYDRIQGSVSLLLLTTDGIYAARDRHGHNPLIVGETKDAIAVATETTAFPNMDFQVKKFLEPGEIVHISPDGIGQRAPGRDSCQVCTFLWIYTGFPASHYEGTNVEIVRERCGRRLAEGDTAEADLAAGVPDSGTAHAIGYAMGRGIPYRRPLVKFTAGYGRSYTPPSQDIRDRIAKMKLVPVREVINGNRVVVCDDSIVRGTQFKNFTVAKLWDCGARAVHVRIACPPIMFPCRYNVSTRSIDELAARRAIKAMEGDANVDVSEYLDPTTDKYQQMVAWIANDLGVTSLKYLTIDDVVEAIGQPCDRLCTYCWNGCGT
ncbi:amidophosphoribosyltransferase [bacterium]|nr:amidophosphoribosyltransferase [bacterium]